MESPLPPPPFIALPLRKYFFCGFPIKGWHKRPQICFLVVEPERGEWKPLNHEKKNRTKKDLNLSGRTNKICVMCQESLISFFSPLLNLTSAEPWLINSFPGFLYSWHLRLNGIIHWTQKLRNISLDGWARLTLLVLSQMTKSPPPRAQWSHGFFFERRKYWIIKHKLPF